MITKGELFIERMHYHTGYSYIQRRNKFNRSDQPKNVTLTMQVKDKWRSMVGVKRSNKMNLHFQAFLVELSQVLKMFRRILKASE